MRVSTFVGPLALACLALGAGCGQNDTSGGGSAATTVDRVTIGSNPSGTNVYAVAAGFAKVLQEQAGLRATIRPFSGSSVYLPMLQRGDISLGLNTSIDSYLSYHGLPPYTDRMDNLRALAVMFHLPIMYMTPANSGIERVEDLRGKRVVVTFRANAALRQLHHAILATGGLEPTDVEALTVAGVPEATQALTEGRADAIPIGLGTALGLQVHSTIPGGIRFITMGRDAAKLTEGMPGSRVATVTPTATTVGVTEPIEVADTLDYLNASTHMPDDLAYTIVKTLHDNLDALKRDYPQMRSMTVEDLAPADNFHPYHPGAVRYFREAGLWTEAHESNQQKLLGMP
ncbi:MAG: TAXI family TRAP transporter solute-binding subunit [Gammaproteobacteria bacterium]|nr:TAXI family TRAP transporter solute-binding subunit [Gammaproteobacteria bacterium]